jgi:hypothetical protein
MTHMPNKHPNYLFRLKRHGLLYKPPYFSLNFKKRWKPKYVKALTRRIAEALPSVEEVSAEAITWLREGSLFGFKHNPWRN